MEAADTLGCTGDPSAGPALFKLYQQSDDDSALRFVIATAMAACQYAEAIPTLIEALSSSNPGLRRQASRGLYLLRAQTAVEPLRMALAAETDPFPKQMMKTSLQQLEHELMFGVEKKEVKIARLIAILQEADTNVERNQVANDLACLSSKQAIMALLPLLHHEKAKVRQIAVWVLMEMGSITDSFLLIREHQEQVQWALIEALNDTDSKMQTAIAQSLMVWGGKEAIAPLLAIIQNGNVDVRKAVVETLASLHHFAEGRTLEPLLNIFFTDADFDVRYLAAEGLGFLDDSQAVNAMIMSLQDKQNTVRKEAACLLSALKDERAVDALIQALQDSDQEVREWAVEGLWLLCSRNGNNLSLQTEEKMRKAMPLALKDESNEVQECAKKILDWLSD